MRGKQEEPGYPLIRDQRVGGSSPPVGSKTLRNGNLHRHLSGPVKHGFSYPHRVRISGAFQYLQTSPGLPIWSDR